MSSQPTVQPLLASGRIEEAVGIWTTFLREQGQDDADSWFSLAGQYQVDGHRLAAEEAYRQLLRRYPGHGGALINLGCVLEDEDRIEEAIACYQQAMDQPAVKKMALRNLERLVERHDFNQAIPVYRQILATHGTDWSIGPPIRLALAKRLALSQKSEAITLFQKIIDDPVTNSAIRADACYHLGLILGNKHSRYAEASVLMEKCIALDAGGRLPDMAWTELATFYCLSGRGDQREVNRVVKTWAQRLPSPVIFPFPARKPGPGRVGICSAAFGYGYTQDHFVNALAPALLRRNIDAICYLLPGSSRQAWEIPVVDVSALSGAAAARVRQDDLDCLITIDLLPMFDCSFYSHRPARFVASMSQALASSGLVDGLLLDRWLMPPDAEDDFCEEILYLKTPGPFVSNLYMLASDGSLPAPPPCLARGHITFGSFNRPDKIDATTVALWAQAMHAVSGSRLYLRAGDFNDTEAHRIRALFAAAGIADRRIDIHGWSPTKDFLSGYGEIDIALDPLNFNGGLTTVQALWQGVPVTTMPGKRIVSRMSASILAAIDREEWIACDAGDWLRIVTELAAAPDELSAWRAELRARLAASTVIDPDLMADNLLTALASHLPARS